LKLIQERKRCVPDVIRKIKKANFLFQIFHFLPLVFYLVNKAIREGRVLCSPSYVIDEIRVDQRRANASFTLPIR